MTKIARASPDPSPASELYEADEHAWIETQIAALAHGEDRGLDQPHLIEYLSEIPAAAPWSVDETLGFDPPQPAVRGRPRRA